MKNYLKHLLLAVLFVPLSAQAATSIPFTVNMSEAVTVSGCPATCPRIAVDVGGVTRYAAYSAGSGTSTLTFTYDMVAGDVDLDGVTVSSPVDLNGGSITDLNGNAIADLTFVLPDTSGILVNAAVPSGYSVAFTDETVTNTNKANMGFTLTYNKANRTYNYTISSSGGGAPLTGTGTTTGAAQNITGIDLTSLPDGKLTLSVTLTDSLGGTGAAATDTLPMAVLDNSLVGHWTFDANDISGTTAYDRSGHGNNGTLTNGPTQTTGQVGGALDFDGVNDYVALPTVSNIRSILVSGLINNTQGGGWRYLLDARNGFVNGWFARESTGGWTGMNVNGTSSAPSWSFPKDTFIVLYIEAPSNFSDDMNIMSRVSNNENLAGRLDDVRIYNRALTPAEISTLYNSMQ